MERLPKRSEIMGSMGVHNLTKDILTMSEDKDIVDRYYDVLLASQVLLREMNEALYGRPDGPTQNQVDGAEALLNAVTKEV